MNFNIKAKEVPHTYKAYLFVILKNQVKIKCWLLALSAFAQSV